MNKLEEWFKTEKDIFKGRYDCHEAELYFRIIEHLMNAVEYYKNNQILLAKTIPENWGLSTAASQAIEACEQIIKEKI